MTQMEMNVLEHRNSLTPAQHAMNQAKSAPRSREEMPPLSVTHIGPDDIKKMEAMRAMQKEGTKEQLPYMMNPTSGPMDNGAGDVV